MPRALPVPNRDKIVRRHQQGEELAVIAVELGLSYHIVRQIWRLCRTLGADGLALRSHACGRARGRGAMPSSSRLASSNRRDPSHPTALPFERGERKTETVLAKDPRRVAVQARVRRGRW
jgi:hypothetical protein